MTHDHFLGIREKRCDRCGLPFQTHDSRVNYCRHCYLALYQEEVTEE